MTRIVNAFTISPHDIQPGDVMLFTVKAMVRRRDSAGRLRYRLYRCPFEGEIPQGDQVLDMAEVCHQLFPSLAAVGDLD